ncbi:hypothetical protein SALBM311S_01728 [Streptomyces alboniger]
MTDTPMNDTTEPQASHPIGRRTDLIATGATAATLAVAAVPETPTAPTTPARDAAPAAAAAVCTLTKEMTEGPDYLDGQLVRSDISEGKAGFPPS